MIVRFATDSRRWNNCFFGNTIVILLLSSCCQKVDVSPSVITRTVQTDDRKKYSGHWTVYARFRLNALFYATNNKQTIINIRDTAILLPKNRIFLGHVLILLFLMLCWIVVIGDKLARPQIFFGKKCNKCMRFDRQRTTYLTFNTPGLFLFRQQIRNYLGCPMGYSIFAQNIHSAMSVKWNNTY